MSSDPKTIGRYRVLGTLGSGGMGVVYLAEDPLLKRRVAVKLVRAAGMELDQALARFQREAEISARLSHPNVITIHDVGEEPGLGPFLTM
ncbi:MAG: protein kinase domain-containing protein, partial [Candidatus Binatia bacterium]